MDERALALRMDERALTSARFGAMACEGSVMFRYAGRDRANCAMCSKVLSMEERALWDGRARARIRLDERSLTSARLGRWLVRAP